jgi:2'-5' RNA ligase
VDEKSHFRFSSGVAESALVVLVPELDVVVGEWYRRHTNAGWRGLPPHVTLLFPFLDTAGLGEEPAGRVAEAFAPFAPFHVTFAETARFSGDQETLYLRPEPADPFVSMTDALVAAFPEQQPYGGAFEEVIPHLTVADGPAPLLEEIEHELAARLPVAVRVERVWLVVDTPSGWQRHSAFPL